VSFQEPPLPAPPRRRWSRRLARWLLFAALAWFAGSVLLVLLLRFVPPPLSAVMAADWLEAKASGDRTFVLRHRWTPWERVSPALPIALVAAEDQRFPLHHGFDFEAIQRALEEADDGERLRGASTISQQVAKNLFLWNGRSVVRKGFEAYFTVLLETLWPKRRILEVYLNIAEFGHGIYGVGAASERFFHATPDRLDARQSALLAAVLPNPARFHVDKPSPYVLRRAAWIQRQANQLGGAAYLPR
jgi:monofunctional biosynthetic peptidoglycan transglycosylase